jgi:acyl-CoA synthetase (AMP-forming)/AMP-acid ligase II
VPVAGRDPGRTGDQGLPGRWDAWLISYAELARHVEQFAGALYELGVRPGDVVACQLPNWWQAQAQALLLAATRLEAVQAPITTTIRPRELERMLRRLGASVCVTVVIGACTFDPEPAAVPEWLAAIDRPIVLRCCCPAGCGRSRRRAAASARPATA